MFATARDNTKKTNVQFLVTLCPDVKNQRTLHSIFQMFCYKFVMFLDSPRFANSDMYFPRHQFTSFSQNSAIWLRYLYFVAFASFLRPQLGSSCHRQIGFAEDNGWLPADVFKKCVTLSLFFSKPLNGPLGSSPSPCFSFTRFLHTTLLVFYTCIIMRFYNYYHTTAYSLSHRIRLR